MLPVISSLHRYIALDAIRGIAAISVLITHWVTWTIKFSDEPLTNLIMSYLNHAINFFWAAGGAHPGVIVFIVLSGFCIHLSQVKRINTNRNKISSYWKFFFLKRGIRIFPVFWGGLLLGLIYVSFVGQQAEFSTGLFFSFLGLGEIGRLIYPLDIFYPGNSPLITVGVEILLYASYPLVLFVLLRFGVYYIFLAPGFFYILIAALRAKGFGLEFLISSYGELFLYWVIGIYFANSFYHRTGRGIYFFQSRQLLICLFIFYLFITHLVKIRGLFFVCSPLFAVIVGLFIYQILSEKRNANSFWAGVFRRLAYFGDRSYSLYAFHAPIILFVIAIFGNRITYSSWVPWMAILASLCAMQVLFYYIELPTHKFERRLNYPGG